VRVRRVYGRFIQLPTKAGLSGAETAAAILLKEGINDVEVVEHDQMLGDHYDPGRKRLVLSRENFYGMSATALAVAAHECGHAIQQKLNYAPLQWRMAAIHLTTFASPIVLWWPFLGLMTGLLNTGIFLCLLTSALGVLMLFNLMTLPVEFDASARARLALKRTDLIQTAQEENAVSAVLGAAAWTYVAALVTSLGYFFMYFLLLLGGRKD
jgi:Zn-dependent membrane protease YugP